MSEQRGAGGVDDPPGTPSDRSSEWFVAPPGATPETAPPSAVGATPGPFAPLERPSPAGGPPWGGAGTPPAVASWGAPQHEQSGWLGGPPPTAPTAGFRSPIVPARIAVVLLAISFVVSVLLVGSTFAEVQLLTLMMDDPTAVTTEVIERSDLRQFGLSVLSIGLVFVTAGAFIPWIHRVYGNLDSFGAGRLRFGTGWAIGGWFVPFLSFVRPKQIVDDAWRASAPGGAPGVEWRGSTVPATIHAWWAAWVLASICGTASRRLSLSGDGIEQIRWSSVAYLVSEVLFAVAAVLAIHVVVALTARQERRAGSGGEMRTPARGMLAAAVGAVLLLGGGAAVAWTPEGSGSTPTANGGGDTSGSLGPIPVDTLRTGDCFDSPESWSGGAFTAVSYVDAVLCTTPHDNEVFAVRQFPEPEGASYPGDDEVIDRSDRSCDYAFRGLYGAQVLDTDLDIMFFHPVPLTWDAGDREIICILYRYDFDKLDQPVTAFR